MFRSQKAWPPYAAGIAIGLVQIPAALAVEDKAAES